MGATSAPTPTDAPATGPSPLRLRWIIPVVVVTVFTSLLGLMYLAYVAKPDQNLRNYPIAVVNNDVGDTIGAPGDTTTVNFGAQVLDAVIANTPGETFDLRVLGINAAQQQMRDGQVYGLLVIPSDFSKRLGNLGLGSVQPGDIPRPTITMQTNPRLGPFSTSISTRFADRTIETANTAIGRQLTDRVQQQLGGADQLSVATRLTLAEPVQPVIDVFHGTPEGSGQGLTAFFYALTILLGGMTGAMTIHAVIDSMLGFAPTEYGPYFSHAPTSRLSRLRTLVIKWAVMMGAAALTAGGLLAITSALGIHVDQPLELLLYSAFAMTAVGVTALTIMAAVGSVGVLVNIIVFVILGMPSAGGTIPVEATPRFIGALAEFEPLRQVYLAIRSLMYFDGHAAAGMGRGFWMTVLGLAIGVISGVLITGYYDRKGLTRTSSPAAELVAA
ncbi:YhgE/Pip domain-containing protein [Nocardia fluminea]|uniref:YhgE/Pip-like protein n=1 Tax=Nocardia fluminea TaxID=134984 RepID=A0A2N3WXH1_9NOCA|nr:ABC transporter permease [Nocardia fluminea]PKV98550.1 YhgE/Pip-like protein [Nocardia fluminea]